MILTPHLHTSIILSPDEQFEVSFPEPNSVSLTARISFQVRRIEIHAHCIAFYPVGQKDAHVVSYRLFREEVHLPTEAIRSSLLNLHRHIRAARRAMPGPGTVKLRDLTAHFTGAVPVPIDEDLIGVGRPDYMADEKLPSDPPTSLPLTPLPPNTTSASPIAPPINH